MILIPAIDLKEGKCVRLRQGRMEDDTVFSDDPVAVATRWVEAGARRLHLVDLDGAFAGKPKNAAVIRAIAQAHPELPIQIGGGIRDEETAEAYLDAGVQYVIIGSRAVRDPHFVEDLCLSFPGHVIVGLDAKDGRVATDGWAKMSRFTAIELVEHYVDYGVTAIVYTDISRDGMMDGFNAEATRKLAESSAIPIIASGGVTDMACIDRLLDIEDAGVEGAILGRALYEGTIDLAAAQRHVDAAGGGN